MARNVASATDTRVGNKPQQAWSQRRPDLHVHLAFATKYRRGVLDTEFAQPV
jgi:hypothetical protein